jgi:TolB-like protein/DNA-binding winged helix-turn-helix (wHTH) protein
MTPGMEENTAATIPASAGYQIGDLIVDPGRQCVTRAGIDIPLPRLSFDLLVTLARAAPDLLSFDELNRRVWPGLVITLETISQRVKLVRGALGDDAHAPRYIGGVRGRGYRMVALVRPLTNRRSSTEESSLAVVTVVTEPIAVELEPSPRDEAIAPSVLASRGAVAAAAVASPGDTGVAAKPVANLTQQPPISRPASHRVNRPVLTLSVLIALGLGYFAADKLWFSRRTTSERPVATLASATTAATPAVSEKAVAVLPFLDMSERKDQEYFSDGLTEELIDMLTKIPDLRVPAQTSSFYFKGKQVTIADIAKSLRVAHVLEGSVRKSGNHLRITAQLVRADNDYHLWSESYDRQLDDIFKVQDEIAGAVVKALKISLMGGSLAGPTRTQNVGVPAAPAGLEARSNAPRSIDVTVVCGFTAHLLTQFCAI